MNRVWLALFLLVYVLLAVFAGFCLGMIVAGYTDWECWGEGNYC